MFGLMRAKTCRINAEEKHFWRLHYCGTCKTIGSIYGQKSRLLLNHDTVFLAEILTVLSNEKVDEWQKSYQSYNCLSLPNNELPISLQFAATANLILSEFKIADHLSDTSQKRFKLAHRIFSKDFLKAEKLLKNWNFPLEKVRKLLQTQLNIENNSLDLNEFSRPTAETTAIFFSFGAKLIERNELTNLLFEIGFNFGKLIYILDAFEDFEKDKKDKQFNALYSIFGETGKQRSISILLDLENKITELISQFPIPDNKKHIFISRLKSNLQKKFRTGLPIIVCKTKNILTFAERFNRAKIRAKELTANYSWATVLPIFLIVLAIAFISPNQAKEAKSARECFDLSFNLMFIGSMIGGVFAIPKNLMPNQSGYTPPTPEDLKSFKNEEGWFKKLEDNLPDCCGDCCSDCCCEGCLECSCEACCSCNSCDCCDCSCDT